MTAAVGTDSNSTSETAKDGIITSDKDAGGNDVVDGSTSALPAPSAVAAGQSLRVRSPSDVYALQALAASQTALPVAEFHPAVHARSVSTLLGTKTKEHARLRRGVSRKGRAVVAAEDDAASA